MGKRDRSSRQTSSIAGSHKIPPSRSRLAFLYGRGGSRRRQGSELTTMVIGILAFVFVVWMVVTLS